MLRDGMPYDMIQGQGHAGLKVPKMADCKVLSLRRYACNQKLTVNSDTPIQYLSFSGQIFDIHPRSASRDLQG